MVSKITAVNLASAFPSYLAPLLSLISSFQFLHIFLFVICLLIILWISLWFTKLRKMYTASYTFLEVKPTYKTLQSAFSTQQLFAVLHSIDKPISLFDRFLGIKQIISYELVSTKETGIRYVLRVPKHTVSLITKSLIAYLPGIEVQEIADYLPAKSDDVQSKHNLTIREVTLTKPFVLPLQDQSLLKEHDPIAYITAHMTKLDEKELVALHFVATPVLPRTHKSITSFIHKLKYMLLLNEDISGEIHRGHFHYLYLFLLMILGSSRQKKGAEVTSSKRELYKTVEDKINQPLFEVTIRLCIRTQDKASTKKRIQGIRSSFDTFATGHQSLTLHWSVFSLLKANVINKWRYFFLKNRILSLSHNPILSASELSSLYHMPYTATTKTEDLINVKSPMLPSPLPLKSSPNNLDMVFAHNTYGETTVPIGLTIEERRRHVYIIGATGTGKTTALLHMIYHDLLKGSGVAIIDPHGDLIHKLLGVIPEERIKDVVYFNPYDIEKPVGLNMLELQQGLNEVETQREKDLIASSMISIFQKLYPPRFTGPRMEHILRNTVLTALELEKPTLMTVYRLLTNKEFRKKTVTSLPKGVLKDFWNDEFGKLGSFQKAEQISPITNKLGRFLTTSITRNILTKNESKLNFENIMNNKKILLCDLSKGKIGEDTSSFLGSLIVAKIQLAALKRVDISEATRTDFFLYIDEFQNFATPSFAQILSEARKYRLNTILAHQTISQIEDKGLFKVILANVGSVISFRTSNPTDEDMILPLFAPQVEKHEISNLPSYHFYMKINAIEPQNAFTGAIDNFVIEENKSIRDEVIKHSQETYGTKKEIKDNIDKTIKKHQAPSIKISPGINKFEAAQ